MMNLLKIGKEPIAIGSTATVMAAVREMDKANIGAILVIDGGELKGIFTERDVMLRVVLQEKDPAKTLVGEVMTTPVLTISKETEPDEVLKMMRERHIRHIPVVDSNGRVQVRISIRHLLHEKVEHLMQELDSLEAYLTADGIGG
jgi:CBS domain-containing protein